MSPNSSESFAAYKDLYGATERLSMKDGLDFESGSEYSISDTAERLAEFR